jgi:CxxC motif-containing protein (DUF1111 family)
MRGNATNAVLGIGLSFLILNHPAWAQSKTARDPGPRTVTSTDPRPLPDLTQPELALFLAGAEKFREEDTVVGGPNTGGGLGPTFNLNSCKGCHSHPQLGGTSPPRNPQFDLWKSSLAKTNKLPWFVKENGPAKEARFIRNDDRSPDGGVHDIFTIAGLPGAGKCAPKQPDFATARRKNNVIFRIPTPTFGAGLIEQISDQEIEFNLAKVKRLGAAAYGVQGRTNVVHSGHTISKRPNHNGNDGTIARFGWKAQNKSLMIFAGEAYNVEMGITNELFPTERLPADPDLARNCLNLFPIPNDATNPGASGIKVLNDVENFAAFMRLLAPPMPSTDEPGGAASISRGRELFDGIGCAVCHTPTLHTVENAAVKALSSKAAGLYSDLALHNMGSGLADGISQGQAGGNDFRTAPLWGLGQRLFLLHDGRTSDLVRAIQEHRSPGSEANRVVRRYEGRSNREKQHLLNFLRSL